jgi:hypothetical protein
MKTAKLIIEGRGIEELPALIKEEFKTELSVYFQGSYCNDEGKILF